MDGKLHGEAYFCDLASTMYFEGKEEKSIKNEVSRYVDQFPRVFAKLNICDLNIIQPIRSCIIEYVDLRSISERAKELIHFASQLADIVPPPIVFPASSSCCENDS
jgi:hypothetical protein